MRRFASFDELPKNARYIGTEQDGTLDEQTADALDRAARPAYIMDEQGDRLFFDLPE